MTLSLGGCAVVASLMVAGKYDEANEYVKHSYATSWNAIQHITEPMVYKLHNVGLPVFAHIWLPSKITSEKMDQHLDKGVDGLMGDQSEMIIAAVNRAKRRRR